MSETNPLFAAIREGLRRNTSLEAMNADLWQRFGETRAILVLDSTGFTRLTRKHGIVYFLTCIVRLRDLAARVFSETNCLSWRGEADNLYAEFAGVDAALSAAMHLHQGVRDSDLRKNDDDPFSVSIGIGYGQVLLAGEEGVYGGEMNLASKLGEDTAEGGQTLLTEAAAAALTRVKGLVLERQQAVVSGNPITYFVARR